jgi:hypothetical protein
LIFVTPFTSFHVNGRRKTCPSPTRQTSNVTCGAAAV